MIRKLVLAVAVVAASLAAGAGHAQAQESTPPGWKSLGPRSGFVWDMAISPAFADDGTVFAGISGGVLKSTDRGDSWDRANKGLTSRFVPALVVSPAYASDGTLFAGTTGDGVFKSVDGGGSWTQAEA